MFIRDITGTVHDGYMNNKTFISVSGEKIPRDGIVTELFKTHGGYIEVPYIY